MYIFVYFCIFLYMFVYFCILLYMFVYFFNLFNPSFEALFVSWVYLDDPSTTYQSLPLLKFYLFTLPCPFVDMPCWQRNSRFKRSFFWFNSLVPVWSSVCVLRTALMCCTPSRVDRIHTFLFILFCRYESESWFKTWFFLWFNSLVLV